jgi:hypothetical protein
MVTGIEVLSAEPIHSSTPLLKASDALDTSKLGIWSRALAKVATEADVLFHVLRWFVCVGGKELRAQVP